MTRRRIERQLDNRTDDPIVRTFINLAETPFADVVRENEAVTLYDRDLRRGAGKVLRIWRVLVRQ